MRKKHRILFAALGVALIGVIALFALRRDEPEPVYQGKPLSAWLAIYDPTNTIRTASELQATQTAIRQMGTNAFPTLLRMLRTRDYPWKEWLFDLAGRQSVIPIHHVPARNLHERAAMGVEVLSLRGKSVVPDLTKLYDQGMSGESQMTVSRVLGVIGPPARDSVPALVRGATSSNEYVRVNTVYALGRIHAEPDIAVPVLIKSLQDPSPLVRSSAAMALGDFGPAAKSAVPALLELQKNPGTNTTPMPLNIPSAVDTALKKIDPETAARVATNSPQPPQ